MQYFGQFDLEGPAHGVWLHIITTEDEIQTVIPNIIKLKHPLPNENPMMHKRSFPAALRFHKPKEENNPHKYFLSELVPYIPFRDKEAEFRPSDQDFLGDIYLKNKQRMQKIKSKVMEHLESVEEARHYVEEVTKKLDLELIWMQQQNRLMLIVKKTQRSFTLTTCTWT